MLLVVVAIDLLDAGEAAVGVLTGAIGAGAVCGSLLAGLLAEGRALTRFEGVGAALWGLPLLGVALVPHEPAVFGFLCAVGPGNALVDECSRTATVRARGDLRLDVISRADFLPAVTGFRPAAHEADKTVCDLLHADAVAG